MFMDGNAKVAPLKPEDIPGQILPPSQRSLEKELEAWRRNSSWIDESPVIQVKTPMFFVSHGVTGMINFWCSPLIVVMLLKITMFKRDMSPLRFCMCKVSSRTKFSVNGISIWSTCCIQNASQLFLVKRLAPTHSLVPRERGSL
jgi:hypothetical protein